MNAGGEASHMTDDKPKRPGQVLANLSGARTDLESVYKDIHAHPELSMRENRTAGMAAARLREDGYEVTTGIGKTGVVGLLRNGDGPTIMLRADMDALPVEEETGLPLIRRYMRKPKNPGALARFPPITARASRQ